MMDELELLKKNWEKKEFPKLTYNEIYKMILKRSSSSVRWIFIISIIEFVVLAVMEIIGRINGLYDKYEEMGIGKNVSTTMSILSFGILMFFMIKFYLNYKKIETTDSAKGLMYNILNTRKTVKYYVFINLSFLTVLLFITFGFMLFYSPEFNELKDAAGNSVPQYVIAILFFVVIVIMVGVIGLIYYLLYGLLVRRLRSNYKELERLEV